jgi:GT2 family glycosyltransferase
MENPVNIAVLMACYNRKELTRRCLTHLFEARADVNLDVFLVDDGSTDGTAEMVRTTWPTVKIVAGTGSLFWSGGMNLAWSTALSAKPDYDAFLWLNDDAALYGTGLDGMLSDLAAVRRSPDDPVIIVGAMQDQTRSRVTYGAQEIASKRKPLRMSVAAPSGAPAPCDTFSGNAVLITRAVVDRVGLLSPDFHHTFSDLDYGLRARKAGVSVFGSSDYVGTCELNTVGGTFADPALSRWRRLGLLRRAENSVHAKDWRTFVRKHSGLGPLGWLYSLAPYLRLILTGRVSSPNRR